LLIIAAPKSEILMSPLACSGLSLGLTSSMFAGLMSRWVMPARNA
jgi:hypothetical protein